MKLLLLLLYSFFTYSHSWDFDSVPEDSVYLSESSGYRVAWVTDKGTIDENDDWKVCTWERQSDGASCRFDYVCEGFFCEIGSGDFHVETNCSEKLKGVQFIGEDPNFHNRQCGVQIPSLGFLDNTVWTVKIEECQLTGCGGANGNGVVIEHSSEVTVLQEPNNINVTSSTLKPGATVAPGSKHQVTCTVGGIRPEPEMSWHCPPTSSCSTSAPVVTPGPEGTVTIASTETITVGTNLGQNRLDCLAKVANTSSLTNIVWEHRTGLQFNVASPTTPKKTTPRAPTTQRPTTPKRTTPRAPTTKKPTTRAPTTKRPTTPIRPTSSPRNTTRASSDQKSDNNYRQ